MVVGHITVARDGKRYSLLRSGVFTKFFVLGDVLSFMVQGTGEFENGE